MPHFAEFMQELATRRSLRRLADGSSVTYRLTLRGTASLTVVTRELDANSGSLVMSEPWPAPVSEAAHLEFMREALRFNRNAMHHLPCGIALDPAGVNQYRLVWQVQAVEAPAADWNHQLRVFGQLTDKAWEVLPRPGARSGRSSGAEDSHHVIFMP